MLKDKKIIIYFCVLMLLITLPLYYVVFALKGTTINYDRLQQNSDETVDVKYNDILTQSFYSDKNQLFSVELMIDNYIGEKDTTKVEYGIRDYNTSEVLYKNIIGIPSVANKTYYPFTFPELKDSKNNKYIFYIKGLEAKNSLKVWKSSNNIYDIGNFKINEVEISADMCFRIDFMESYPLVYKVYFAIFIFTLVGLSASFMLRRYFVTLEKSFIVLGLVFGTFMTFFVPPAQVPDEIVHFFRAYEVSQGDFIPTKDSNGSGVGSYMPQDIYNFIKVGDFERMPTKYNEKVDIDDLLKSTQLHINDKKNMFVDVGGTSIYMPVQYFPQSIGIIIGKILSLPIIVIFYLGRLVNMLTWLISSYLAMKIIPFGKKILFLVSLTPMIVQQASSMSPDSMLIGISFLFTSYCLYLAFIKEKIDYKDIIKILTMALIIVSMKVVYTPIILLITLIDAKKFNGKKNLILLTTSMILAGILMNMLWFNAVSFLNTFKVPSESINSVQQVKFVLLNPFEYIKTLFNTYVQLSRFYIESSVGILGWLDNSLPYPLVYSYIFLIIFISIVSDGEETIEMSYIHKGILLFTSVCIILLVVSSLYVAWTNVGANIVSGVQGRYFIPIILSLLLTLTNNKVIIKSKNLLQYLVGYEIWVFAYTIIMIICRYYVAI